MKKRTFIILLTLFVISLVVNVFSVSNEIKAYVTDIKLYSTYDYPLISYNDNTYMAVRDVAKLLHKNIDWNEELRIISFHSRKYDDNEYIIRNKETVLKIAAAIAEEYFPDRITPNTKYYAFKGGYSSTDLDDPWTVEIIFNLSKELDTEDDEDMSYLFRNTEAEVTVNPLNGCFGVKERFENEVWHDIVKMKFK